MLKKRLIVLALAGALSVGAYGAARADILGGTLGTVIKVFGIGYAVKAFGPQINSFINGVMGQRGYSYEGATKVVPILSIGRGLYIGAAQVMGAPSRVAEVKAVGQGEIAVGGFSLHGLFPTNATVPFVTGTPATVGGVGVNAIIDFHV